MTEPRPWLCPEPICNPIHNLRDGDYKDIRIPEPGQSFLCAGIMQKPVEFTYDRVIHNNNLNSCSYTPLKGLIRWQETAEDWQLLEAFYKEAQTRLVFYKLATKEP